MIEVKNLIKKYGNHVAVDYLSFSVKKGQIYGFLGPNGAGKSTTMNIMTGYLGATEGEVIINGHDILKEPEIAKRSIGYLPEIPPLYTEMTVLEYLEFSSELKKIRKAERERSVEEVIELTQLTDVQERLIKNLSKGYRQRVGLAQAILGFPEIIILDEPMVGLDPKQIIEVRELIRNLAKNHTVILSSHILAEISEMCDQILIIAKGKLVASGTPEELEKMMSGSDIIVLEAEGTSEQIENILCEIDTETEFRWTVREDGNVTKAEIEVDDKDIRREIFRAFAKADCPLLTLKKEEASLEKVFLELIEEDKENDSDL